MCMNLVVSITIVIIVGIILYNVLRPSLKEGVQNSTCESDINTMVYKNSGTLQSLEEKVEKLMEQVNKSIISQDKNTTDISSLQEKQAKNDKLTLQAASLASDNKERLVEIAKENSAKFNSAQSDYNKTGRIDA